MNCGATDAVLRVPFVSLNPNYAATYSRPVDNYGSRVVSDVSKNNLKDNKHVGDLSASAKKRLLNTVNWMVYACRHGVVPEGCENLPKKNEIGFITLTLSAPQIHHDKEIKSKMLNHFLTVLRQKYGVLYYVWKAEKQKNGNIHFHITIDRYIKWQDIRSEWNKIQEKAGYISRYAKRMNSLSLSEYTKLMAGYGLDCKSLIKESYLKGKKSNWSNPNSTDIHAVKKVKNIAAYVGKYVSKSVKSKASVLNDRILKDSDFDIDSILSTSYEDLDDDLKQLITGRIWGCSQILSKLKNVQDVICDDVRGVLDDMSDSDKVKRLDTDYSTMFYFKAPVFIDKLFRPFHRLLQNYIRKILTVIEEVEVICKTVVSDIVELPVKRELVQYKLL